MAPRWRWLLVVLAAVAVSCIVPGSMLSQAPSLTRSAAIEVVSAIPSGSECAAVSCNRGSPSVSAPVPAVAVIGVLTTGAVTLLLAGRRRRTRAAAMLLPAGTPLQILRPPQG